MANEPRVSVCIPTYKGVNLVQRALESCCRQTYPNLEIVVVDDASPDRTVEIVQAYADRDPRIKLFQNEHNLGAARNFLETFRRATGEFVQHLGQDDWLEETHIAEKVAVFQQHPDIAFVANAITAYVLTATGEISLVGKTSKRPGFYSLSEVIDRFYREPGLLGFFCMMRQRDAVEQYLYHIPTAPEYDQYYEKAMAIDNILLLRILNLKRYQQRYYYTDQTSYHTLSHPEHFSGDYGWMKPGDVADRIKFAHIDRVGYEFFFASQPARHRRRYRIFTGTNVLADVVLDRLLGRTSGQASAALKHFFVGYTWLERLMVWFKLPSLLLVRAINGIVRRCRSMTSL